jgi:hypothetical protein
MPQRLKSAAGEEKDNVNYSSYGARNMAGSGQPQVEEMAAPETAVEQAQLGTLGDGSKYEAQAQDLGTRVVGQTADSWKEGYTPFSEELKLKDFGWEYGAAENLENAAADWHKALYGFDGTRGQVRKQWNDENRAIQDAWNKRKSDYESQWRIPGSAGTTQYGTQISLRGQAPYSYASASDAASNAGKANFDAGTQTNWGANPNDLTLTNSNAAQQAAINRLRGR